MTGLTLIAIGLFLSALGGTRYFVARPRPGTESTGFDKGDFIASKLLLGTGVALSIIGVVSALIALLF